jgi:hypothetical protein
MIDPAFSAVFDLADYDQHDTPFLAKKRHILSSAMPMMMYLYWSFVIIPPC